MLCGKAFSRGTSWRSLGAVEFDRWPHPLATLSVSADLGVTQLINFCVLIKDEYVMKNLIHFGLR